MVEKDSLNFNHMKVNFTPHKLGGRFGRMIFQHTSKPLYFPYLRTLIRDPERASQMTERKQ